MAIEGMDPKSKEDISAASEQAPTLDTELQYDEALELVKALLREGVINASNLTSTGNSLGGGLAAYAGLNIGIKTITFNAAGVHPDNVGPHTDMVTIYFMSEDSRMQEKHPWLPEAIGNRIMVSPAPDDRKLGEVGRHFIGPMQRALEWWGM